MTNSKIKYVYIRDENRFPIGCIAYLIEDNTFRYGLSTYCPKDKFDKHLARKISAGRLMSNPHGFAIRSGEHSNEILADLCTLLYQNRETPTRIHKRLIAMRDHFLAAKRSRDDGRLARMRKQLTGAAC